MTVPVKKSQVVRRLNRPAMTASQVPVIAPITALSTPTAPIKGAIAPANNFGTHNIKPFGALFLINNSALIPAERNATHTAARLSVFISDLQPQDIKIIVG